MGNKEPKKRTLGVYANLAHKRRTKKDEAARKRAEYLATLPKHPLKRFLFRLHPKRVAAYWFSKRGLLTLLKIFIVVVILVVLGIGSLFAYYRKDIDQIRPDEISKRVQTTVTKYLDRNGQLLYEDKGQENYKLVIQGDQMSKYVRDATVAIEDKDFLKHHGISIIGIIRAAMSNARGNSAQGGSTLTQQLVKQVFFANEADNRGISGIPRKIKEIILAIEVEHTYDKAGILTLYLNESPYGGRRNGIESASQTYFHKSAKDLDLAEAALLAGIPNQPGLLNPYNTAGHKQLIERQHTVLDRMVEQGFITKEEAANAKQVAILDKIHPAIADTDNITAPHFVLSVREQLENELGKATVGQGGLTVTTTLDKRVQDKLQTTVTDFFKSGRPGSVGISNTAATVEDNQTGQIIAQIGSRDYNYPGFGQTNASESYLQPGSTVKSLVFAELFKNKGSNKQNYGSGSVLKDEKIDNIYGAPLQNHDGRFMGNITIRQGLALSRNVPAVKAMYISGIKPTLQTINDAGAHSYCQQEQKNGVGLSASIGACTVKQTELVNAYATLGRLGVYKPITRVLEVKNSQGDTLKKWKDDSKRVLDPQIPYIIGDILSDQQAAAALHGNGALAVPGVRTASKTGTSDINRKPKDLWLMTYSSAITMGVWLGNNDTRNIKTSDSAMGNKIIAPVLEYAHKQIYAPEGKWKSGDWLKRPDGIQQQGKELYPSWWNKSQGNKNAKLTFDKVSKKLATECTPDSAKVTVDVTKTTDPITKKEAYADLGEYNEKEKDDVHKCTDRKPTVDGITITRSGNSYQIRATVQKGDHDLQSVDFRVGNEQIKSESISSSGVVSATYEGGDGGTKTVTITVHDSAEYTGSASGRFSVATTNN